MVDLTPAEARLAVLIAVGMALPDAARALGVALTTVRKQLQALFRKTETDRQAALALALSRAANLSAV